MIFVALLLSLCEVVKDKNPISSRSGKLPYKYCTRNVFIMLTVHALITLNADETAELPRFGKVTVDL